MYTFSLGLLKFSLFKLLLVLLFFLKIRINYLNKNGFLFKTKLSCIVVILIFTKFFTKLYTFNFFDF